MAFVPSQAIALLILNFIVFDAEKNKVEARPKEVIPVPGWFNNVEGFIVPNLNVFQSTEPSYVDRNLGTDEIMDALRRKKNKKKKKRIAKKVAMKLQKEEDKKKLSEHGSIKKKKKHRGNRLKFIKSKVNENDSHLSESKEKQLQKNPVDIIVHIKMNE